MSTLVFSNTTTKLGLIQRCEKYCNLGDQGISANAQRLLEFTGDINEGGSKIWQWIFMASGGWKYDDSNQTDLPQATQNLDSGTGKYTLPDGALVINKIQAKDSAGNWVDLAPYDLEQLEGVAEEEWQKTNGVPNAYRLLGSTIILKPAPSYDSTGGLKVFFDRGSVAFVSTDTTKTPGFDSLFHDLPAVYASMQWWKVKDPQNGTLAMLRGDWQRGEEDVKEFYSKKWPANQPKVRTKRINWK